MHGPQGAPDRQLPQGGLLSARWRPALTVQAIWKAHGLSPHRWRNFVSNDPAFAESSDIVGLYVDPPAHAVVLSIDEKSQIQALPHPARPADEEGPRRHHDP